MSTPPRILTIAGSDSGGGAGIQADLKTFAAHRVYGMSVITSITAQNTVAVTAVHPVPPEVVAEQIDAVLTDIGADAVKIGMLGTAETVRVVADRLASHKVHDVVLDPVMVAKSGDRLLARDAVRAMREELLPLATVVTPNLPEVEELFGRPVDEVIDSLATELNSTTGAILVKGGHAPGSVVEDLLFEGGRVHRFRHPRVETTSTHGTGCTLSAAIAARLGLGASLPDAVGGAIEYLQHALAAAYPLGSGHGPVNHQVPTQRGSEP